MNSTALACKGEKRRQMVRDQAGRDGGLNGIDFVEVIDDTGQRELCVHFFGEVPDGLVPANVRIEGGERITDLKVLSVEAHDSPDPDHVDCLRVTLDKSGDFSCYRLCLFDVEDDGGTSEKPLRGFDPRYVCSTVSFKIDCPRELDCKDENICQPEPPDEPEINYLAKDYASFRQLILDRFALLVPDWREGHVPDIGVTLVELLAYVGDHLSYYQDAVATEAYLDTARERISVRRHARLVDYFLHDGCNSRSWLFIECEADRQFDPKEIYFITDCSELADIGPDRSLSQEKLDELNIRAGRYEVFEPVVEDREAAVRFYTDHNKISFYTWGDAQCCLPIGATMATLVDRWIEPNDEPPTKPSQSAQSKQCEPVPNDGERQRALRNLRVGDILIFEEVVGPKTGEVPDADPTHRWAVRLTRVTPVEDPLTATPIVDIEWEREDALPFPLCLSSTLPAPECSAIEDVSIAHGNVILVDHGKTICEEIDGVVPTSETIGECVCDGAAVEYTNVAGRFRPALKNYPLTFRETVSYDSAASVRLRQDPRKALPAAILYGVPADEISLDDDPCKYERAEWRWYPKQDLLGSYASDTNFVVETDNEGVGHVRFGDGECGRMPEAGTAFTATYRIGNGIAGNVAADTIAYMITRNVVSGAGIRPRNPIPASGGSDPEPIAEAKLFAPGAFRKKLERAVTAEDYGRIAAWNPKVQRATAGLRWTGSWYDAHVAIDSMSAETLSSELRKESKGLLHRHRRIGHDLSINAARYVPLDIELEICVEPHYLRAHVKSALLDVFSDRNLAGGGRWFFHPDNLTFGDGIYLSSLVAAAQSVTGVAAVSVTKLQRLFENANDEIANGVLPLAANEIAQLDNDPNFPERGKLVLKMNGGR
jgi:hypothetical protein